MDIEIGKGKTGRRAYGLDEIAIVPSRRTRDPQDVDISWRLGNLQLDLPCMASALDAAVDTKTAITIGRLGGLAVLNLEGLQTRYEEDRKSTRLNSSHANISYAVFCLNKHN